MSAEPVTSTRPFGQRYQLLRLLATGGMAEIYLARQLSLDGFDKELVIKRLKPELARDRRVVDMFTDEARIGALLNHPHVVHVYDVGVDDGVPFIAMEYIAGEELNLLCRRGIQLGNFLPLGHAVELVRQAALALGYFHGRQAPGGGRLEIVHADISPTNLLVTEDGYLKVIDFGIAQARGGRYRDDRAVPGKLSYMSPEQAARKPLDARSDVFSLGVVLYEITLGRRLFKGPAGEVVRRLVNAEIKPPTFIRREFPGHLEAIIMRALEREPAERFAGGFDLALALEGFLREAKLETGAVRIARYLDELAVAEGRPARRELELESDASEPDEALDFDRDMFRAFQPAPGQPAAEPREWDELEEGDQAVADALGIDVGLVKTATVPAPASEPAEAVPNPVADLDTDRIRQRGARAAPPAAVPVPAIVAVPPALPPVVARGAVAGRVIGFGLGLALGVLAMLLLRWLT